MASGIKTIGLCALLAALSTGCASIVSQTSWPLAIQSMPPGAAITILNKSGKEIYRGNTPARVRLKSGNGYFTKAEYVVNFQLNGYQPRTVPVNFEINGWFWGNVLFGGFIGWLIVDPITGAMWKIDSENMTEVLVPFTTAGQQPQLRVMNLHDVPEELRACLVPLN